jgi:hypothetical protein
MTQPDASRFLLLRNRRSVSPGSASGFGAPENFCADGLLPGTTPRLKTVAPHWKMITPHQGMVVPHWKMTAPHQKTVAPHPDMIPPHIKMIAPLVEITPPHSEMVAPHWEMVAPRPLCSIPYHRNKNNRRTPLFF